MCGIRPIAGLPSGILLSITAMLLRINPARRCFRIAGQGALRHARRGELALLCPLMPDLTELDVY